MENMKYKLNEEAHQRIFKKIVRNYFRKKFPVNNCKAIILGGQPASGKSGLIELSEKLFLDNNVIKINGDELRKYHPYHKKIYEMHDKDFAKLTDPDVRRWTKNLFDIAIQKKYNIIFEGTMRTNQIYHTIKNLKLNGYNVFIKALAVNELKSRSGIYQRYIKQIKSTEYARFTEQSIHDAAYTGMLETLKQIEEEKLYDELKIYQTSPRILHLLQGGDESA